MSSLPMIRFIHLCVEVQSYLNILRLSLAFFNLQWSQEKHYITQALEDNPGWVGPLANLMRMGALNALLRQDQGSALGIYVGPLMFMLFPSFLHCIFSCLLPSKIPMCGMCQKPHWHVEVPWHSDWSSVLFQQKILCAGRT